MWKSLLLGLLVSLHTKIFLVFMRNYEAKSPLFMIKRAGLNYVPRQSYSKNSHGSYILKWILVHFDLVNDSYESLVVRNSIDLFYSKFFLARKIVTYDLFRLLQKKPETEY